MKRLIVLASMAVALAGVAGCSSGAGGQPVPATTGSGTGTSSANGDPGDTPTSQPGSGNVADMNSCSLLTASEATSAGLPSAGTTQNLGGKSSCEWDGSSYSVIVGIRTDAGLGDVQASGGTLTDREVGTHQAKQVLEPGGDCVISIGISNSSRVDVNAEGNGENACQESLAVAQLVEKHLP